MCEKVVTNDLRGVMPSWAVADSGGVGRDVVDGGLRRCKIVSRRKL